MSEGMIVFLIFVAIEAYMKVAARCTRKHVITFNLLQAAVALFHSFIDVGEGGLLFQNTLLTVEVEQVVSGPTCIASWKFIVALR
jgi:hypothetical protein